MPARVISVRDLLSMELRIPAYQRSYTCRTNQEMIAGGSLKLRKIAGLTAGVDDWKQDACQRHENEMVHMLHQSCGITEKAAEACDIPLLPNSL